jgi:siroheme synthase
VSPFVSFVGAGPGEADLITLKAVRRLREAAVIIHDRLIPAEALEHARATAEVIDVGRAPGRDCIAQTEINWMLVDRARRRGRVVRLKCGDPGVFARLAEEIEAVRAASIGSEIVPGVSAASERFAGQAARRRDERTASRRLAHTAETMAADATTYPRNDSIPAIGAACVSSRRCESACQASAPADSQAPATAMGRATLTGDLGTRLASALDVERRTPAAPR